MAKQKTIKCVECKKTSETEEFPYEKGWKYIYDLEWKTAPKVKSSMHDVHFCSVKCVVEFLKKHI